MNDKWGMIDSRDCFENFFLRRHLREIVRKGDKSGFDLGFRRSAEHKSPESFVVLDITEYWFHLNASFAHMVDSSFAVEFLGNFGSQ